MKLSANKKYLIFKAGESFRNSFIAFRSSKGWFYRKRNKEIGELKEQIEKLKGELTKVIDEKSKLDSERLELLKENNYLKHGIRKIQMSLSEYRQPDTNKHYSELYIAP